MPQLCTGSAAHWVVWLISCQIGTRSLQVLDGCAALRFSLVHNFSAYWNISGIDVGVLHLMAKGKDAALAC
eukprot:1161334-Pelagomonas_calceolata.AAC.1